MAIRLTAQQQLDLDSTESRPPRVVDPRTEAAYVLVPLAEYRDLRNLAEDEAAQRAIRRMGLRNAAGRLSETS